MSLAYLLTSSQIDPKTLTAYLRLSSPPTYPLHLPTLHTYLASHSADERLRVYKVSAKGNTVFKDMASKSLRTECMRNQGCRIYSMTARITASAMKSCRI